MKRLFSTGAKHRGFWLSRAALGSCGWVIVAAVAFPTVAQADIALAPEQLSSQTGNLQIAQSAIDLQKQSVPQLPEPIALAVIQATAQRTGQPVTAFRIVAAEPRTWSDSCLGLASPDTACAQVIEPGWRVQITNGATNWNYRTNASGLVVRQEPTSSQVAANNNDSPKDRQSQQGWETVLKLGRLVKTQQIQDPALVVQLAVLNKPVTTYANTIYEIEARQNKDWIQVYTSTGARLIPNGTGSVTLPPEVIPLGQLQLRRLNSNPNLSDLELRAIVHLRYDLADGRRDVKLQLERTQAYDAIAETKTPQLIGTRSNSVE